MKKSLTALRKEIRERRHRRIRVKVSGTDVRPRLSVYRSNTCLYIQLVNDEKGATIAAVRTTAMKGKTALARAKEAGSAIAEKAKALKINQVVFDRSGYVYAGKVKAIAEGAREGGLSF